MMTQLTARDRRRIPGSGLRCNRGATAIEFALVVIPFLAVLGAIFETALVTISKITLDGAVVSLARQDFAAGATIPTQVDFRTQLCAAPVLMLATCTNPAAVCIAAISAPTDFPTTYPITSCSAAGYAPNGSDRCFIVRVEYAVPALFDLIGLGLGLLGGSPSKTSIMVGTTAIVRRS